MQESAIVVAGAGIAGLSAALAVREAGHEVVVLERAPLAERGGNTRFSNGAFRAARDGGAGGLTREQFWQDMQKVTRGRTDPELARLVVDASGETLDWLRRFGVVPYVAGQSTWNQGASISDALFQAAADLGVEVRYETRAERLIEDAGVVTGIEVSSNRRRFQLRAGAVILAAGGFEANPEWRARYIGPGWDLVKVRGSRFNTGDGLRMALEAAAMPYGHWSGCHSTNWDAGAPDQNLLEFTTVFKRDAFNFGIIVNARGERFLDEGEDFSGLIYARLGPVILAQPGGVAWQVYDAKTASLLPPEYRDLRSARVEAGSLEELAERLDGIDGIDRVRFLATVREFNASIRDDAAFDRSRKDGRCALGLAVPKSNWARAIDEPPFEAYRVTTGITFTFGGVRIDGDAHVLDRDGQAIRGLYAAGEMAGGLFYFNYPGGAGLTAAAVIGRRAGQTAVAELRSKAEAPLTA
jgi:tricarballylate dehydrogenase